MGLLSTVTVCLFDAQSIMLIIIRLWPFIIKMDLFSINLYLKKKRTYGTYNIKTLVQNIQKNCQNSGRYLKKSK